MRTCRCSDLAAGHSCLLRVNRNPLAFQCMDWAFGIWLLGSSSFSWSNAHVGGLGELAGFCHARATNLKACRHKCLASSNLCVVITESVLEPYPPVET